ncbi:hypothetical protein, partial [Halorubrum sp. C191]|uniref:hypothetical protein n=1 Tax=Halorubrum sp. C191 TaxID=1383842 RepID=UPI0011819640
MAEVGEKVCEHPVWTRGEPAVVKKVGDFGVGKTAREVGAEPVKNIEREGILFATSRSSNFVKCLT